MRVVRVIAIVAGLTLAATAAIAAAADSPERTGGRIGGTDRFETAAAIAAEAFPDGAETAYLARHDAFPDALAASSLTDGPVLLAPPCGPIPVVVLAALDDLGVGRVVALGGDAAVADQMVDQAVAGEVNRTLACPGTVPSNAVGLSLAAEAEGDDSVRLVLANARDTSVESGREFVLERRDGAGFDPLDPPVGPFPDNAVMLEPGGELVVAEVGPTVAQGGQERRLAAGTYRARMTVDGVHVAAVFEYPPR